MAANVIEKLQEAIKACEEISAKDLKGQKEEIAKQFGELQKAVYEIVDEKGVILSNYTWIKKEVCGRKGYISFDAVLNAEAKIISAYTGYSEEVIKELLESKNAYNYLATAFFKEITYEFWTIKI